MDAPKVEDKWVEIWYTGVDFGRPSGPLPFSGNSRMWLSRLAEWTREQFEYKHIVQIVEIKEI